MHWGATVLKTLSETCKATGSKWAVSYCTGTLSWGKSEDSVTLGLPSWSDRGGKRRETAGTGSICSRALGSSKQGQSSNSLQMEPTGAWPLAGDRSPTMAQDARRLAQQQSCSLGSPRSGTLSAAPRQRPWGIAAVSLPASGREGSFPPGTHLRFLYIFPSSHIVRLYSMPLLAEMPDQGRRLQRRLWACR